jgi:hypothetical protein
VFDWIRASFDGVIFLLWFLFALGALNTLYAFVTTLSLDAIAVLIQMGLSGYFCVIAVSLLKESTIIVFSIAHNVERIAQRR